MTSATRATSVTGGGASVARRPPVAPVLAVVLALAAAVSLGLVHLEWERSGSARLPAMVVSSPAESPWVGRSPAGVTVSVSPPAQPLHPGPAQFEITTDRALASTETVTVDLVSPSMSMHGITRFDAVRVRPRVYLVRLDIPMEGHWALYVNLGSDEDAAAVEFDVTPAPGTAPGGAPRHHPASHGS